MGRIGKILALLLTLIIIMSSLTLLTVKPVNAEPDINAPIPIPSVPEFTIKYVDHSYDVPTTTTSHTDPYTGEVTTEIHQGYHVENFTMDITIKNQVFPASIDGYALGMRFSIQTKGHFENDWKESYVDTQSTSGYTIVALSANSYPAGGTVDFRVMARLGYYTPPISDGRIAIPASFLYPRPSDWSSIQWITIPENNNSPTLTSNPSPTIPEFPFVVVLSLFVVILLITLFVKKRLCLKAYN
jgi:hypothetical protein